MGMNHQERLALVAALLNLAEDMELMEYVVVAHIHESGDCEGLIKVTSITQVPGNAGAVTLMVSGIETILTGQHGPFAEDPEFQVPPEWMG